MDVDEVESLSGEHLSDTVANTGLLMSGSTVTPKAAGTFISGHNITLAQKNSLDSRSRTCTL